MKVVLDWHGQEVHRCIVPEVEVFFCASEGATIGTLTPVGTVVLLEA